MSGDRDIKSYVCHRFCWKSAKEDAIVETAGQWKFISLEKFKARTEDSTRHFYMTVRSVLTDYHSLMKNSCTYSSLVYTEVLVQDQRYKYNNTFILASIIVSHISWGPWHLLDVQLLDSTISRSTFANVLSSNCTSSKCHGTITNQSELMIHFGRTVFIE